MAAPTFVAGASTTWASGTSQSLTIPGGASVGDLAVVAVGINGSPGNNVSMPAGWTKKYQTTLTGWGDTYAMLAVFYKVLASGEPGSSVTITLANSIRGSANVQTYAGAFAGGDPFDAFGTSEAASSGDPATASFTTSEETTLYSAITIDSTSITLTAPTSFTRRYTTPGGSDRSDSADYAAQAAGSKTVTWTLSSNNRNAVFAGGIKGAAGGLTAPLATTAETDTSVAVGRQKRKAHTVVTETGVAQPVGRRKVKALATVTEADASVDVGRTKVQALAVAGETNTAQSLALPTRVTLTPAEETESAISFGKRKQRAIGPALEEDVAGLVTEPVHEYQTPTYPKVYRQQAVGRGPRYHLDQGVSIVRVNGVLRIVRSPAPEQLEAAGAEGVDWFIGGHIYVVSAGTLAELTAGGFA